MANSSGGKSTRTRTVNRSTSDLSPIELKNRLQKMNGYHFEYLIADLWEEWGWQTTVTKQSNDGGVDVVAKSRIPSPQKWLIQAKCYSSSLSSSDLREYAGLLLRNDGADRVVVVSTAGFTKPARDDSEKYDRLQLIDGDTLVGIVDKRDSYGILDEYDDLQLEPTVESVSSSKPESGTTAVDNTSIESRNKEMYFHNLSEEEVIERVNRIEREGVHPVLSL